MRRFLVAFFLALPLYAQTDFTLRGVTRHPGKVIIEFRDPPLLATSSSPKTVAAAFAATVNRLRAEVPGLRVRYRYFRAFNGVSVTASGKTLDRIRALPYVKAIHPDLEVKAHGAPDTPSNVKQVGAPEVWSKYGTRGGGIVVAIIDTGIDYSHPALGGGFGPGHRVIGGHDFANDDDDPMDDVGHGTHVAANSDAPRTSTTRSST